ncbi:MAG TPA: hypothetical protein VMD30_06010 [Tepidisphaeraceae bacterium]|nr:hypothetical protein [Tepidisphaeraceae bacterium]
MRHRLIPFIVLLLTSIAFAQTDPVIPIHTGRHFCWYSRKSIWDAHQADIRPLFDYMDRVYDQIVADWHIAPRRQQYYFWIDPHTGGGFATGDIGEIHDITQQNAPGIGVSYDAFSNVAFGIKGFWAYAVATHESVNMMTGSLSPGWPRDWWADDKSPFPGMTAVRVEAELGMNRVSRAHDRSFGNDKIYTMMKALQKRYGWAIFRNAFAMVKNDGIQWDHIDLGYNPSAILTAYVSAYLAMASGDSLDHLSTNYFDTAVPGYNSTMTAQVIFARAQWTRNGGDGQAFLSGHYLSVGGFPDYAIAAPSADSLWVAPGHGESMQFHVRRLAGFAPSVAFSVTGLPPGLMAAFNQSGDDVQLILSAAPDARQSAATLTISGRCKPLVPESAGHAMTLPVIVSSARQVPVNLASVATLYGIGNDHLVTGDNGGIDGSGFAYSGVLLGPSQSFAQTEFAMPLPATGAQGTYNAVSGVTIPLPPGRFSFLRVLASANGGDQHNRRFTIHYSDGSRATFTQDVSDWTQPQNFPGETIVLTMPYCDINLNTFHADRSLYGYTFKLDPTKTVASFTLPGRRSLAGQSHVVAVAMTLVP